MPLCELLIPNTANGRLSPKIRNEAATSLCDIALTGTLKFLKIPDPDDRDSRTIVSDRIADSRLILSFTCGPNEYEEGKNFEPDTSQIRTLGLGILAYANKSELNVSQVVVEAWHDTTFIMRSPDETGMITPPTLESKNDSVRIEAKPTITLTLSPDIAKNCPSNEENELPENNNALKNITQGLLGLTQINLNLLEEIGGEIRIQFAHIAETDISVEIDFQDIDTPLFSDEERKNLANEIMRYLDRNEGTKTGTATVWVRQGKPETYVFTPKDLE